MRRFSKPLLKALFAASALIALAAGSVIVSSAAKPYELKLTDKYKGKKIIVWVPWEETDVMLN
ncbi:MAG: hypothetical protein ACM3WV_07370, partial [Bacillota bacterium]